jgi:hypothetical protein
VLVVVFAEAFKIFNHGCDCRVVTVLNEGRKSERSWKRTGRMFDDS